MAFSVKPSRHGSLAWFLAVLLTTGCSTWRVAQVPTAAVPAPPVYPDALKLRTSDGRKLTLHEWSLEGDSLRGWREEWVDYTPVHTNEAFRLSEVSLGDAGVTGESLRPVLEGMEAEANAKAAKKSTSSKGHGTLRVHLVDGRTVVLKHASVEGDSLRGALEETPVAFALRDVETAEVRRADLGANLGVVLIVGLVIVGGYILLMVLFGSRT